jgi:hypothetical protein
MNDLICQVLSAKALINSQFNLPIFYSDILVGFKSWYQLDKKNNVIHFICIARVRILMF